MIVVDASVLVTGLADDGPSGDAVRARLDGEDLIAPHLIDVEILAAWRRLVTRGDLEPRRFELALQDLISLPVRRVPHWPLLARCWELRENLTMYDAVYVAIAEALGISLLTTDLHLARAPGPQCPVEVL